MVPSRKGGEEKEEKEEEEEGGKRERDGAGRDATSSRFASCQPRSAVTRHGKKDL